MPKKTKSTKESQSFSGILKEITLENGTLAGKTQLQFSSGINLFKYTSFLDKQIFSFMLHLALDPYFISNHRKITSYQFNMLKTIIKDPKKSLSFVFLLNIPQTGENKEYKNFLDNFVKNDEIKVELLINSDKEVRLNLFVWSSHYNLEIYSLFLYLLFLCRF